MNSDTSLAIALVLLLLVLIVLQGLSKTANDKLVKTHWYIFHGVFEQH